MEEISTQSNGSQVLAVELSGVAPHTQICTQGDWHRLDAAFECQSTDSSGDDRCPSSEEASQSVPPPTKHPTWKILTENGTSLHLSPNQVVFGRVGEKSGWYRAADLTPDDFVAVLTGDIPDEISDTVAEPVGELLDGPIAWSNSAAELEAYAYGVALNAPSTAAQRLPAPIVGDNYPILDPVWLSRADPFVLARCQAWAESARLPTMLDPRACACRMEALRLSESWRANDIHAQHLELTAPNSVRAAFLRGLFDRWGIPTRDGIHVPLTEYRLSYSLELALLRPFGIACKKTLVRHRREERPSIVLSAHWAKRFHEVIGFGVLRKHAQSATWLEDAVGKDPEQRGPFLFEKLINVECRGRQPLIDLGKTWCGLMVANGIVTFAGDLT